MPSIADAASLILSMPAPVLLIDTCSLVDIIRAPARPPKMKGCVESAVELRRMVSATPRECHLAIGSFVPREWAKHAEPTRIELERHLKDLEESAVEFHEACGHLGNAPVVIPSYTSSGLSTQLHSLSSILLGHAISLEADHQTNMRAFARATSNVPPSIKGGEIKDSTILEECLELCRQLRAAGFAQRLIFCTSNTTDYCERNQLHRQLVAEFAPLAIHFVTTLPWAVSELKSP